MNEVLYRKSAPVIFLPERLRAPHVEKLHHSGGGSGCDCKSRVIEVEGGDFALLSTQDSYARTRPRIPELPMPSLAMFVRRTMRGQVYLDRADRSTECKKIVRIFGNSYGIYGGRPDYS